MVQYFFLAKHVPFPIVKSNVNVNVEDSISRAIDLDTTVSVIPPILDPESPRTDRTRTPVTPVGKDFALNSPPTTMKPIRVVPFQDNNLSRMHIIYDLIQQLMPTIVQSGQNLYRISYENGLVVFIPYIETSDYSRSFFFHPETLSTRPRHNTSVYHLTNVLRRVRRRSGVNLGVETNVDIDNDFDSHDLKNVTIDGNSSYVNGANGSVLLTSREGNISLNMTVPSQGGSSSSSVDVNEILRLALELLRKPSPGPIVIPLTTTTKTSTTTTATTTVSTTRTTKSSRSYMRNRLPFHGHRLPKQAVDYEYDESSDPYGVNIHHDSTFRRAHGRTHAPSSREITKTAKFNRDRSNEEFSSMYLKLYHTLYRDLAAFINDRLDDMFGRTRHRRDASNQDINFNYTYNTSDPHQPSITMISNQHGIFKINSSNPVHVTFANGQLTVKDMLQDNDRSDTDVSGHISASTSTFYKTVFHYVNGTEYETSLSDGFLLAQNISDRFFIEPETELPLTQKRTYHFWIYISFASLLLSGLFIFLTLRCFHQKVPQTHDHESSTTENPKPLLQTV